MIKKQVMPQYINKSALIAELEKRIEETKSMQPKFDQFWAGQISAFKGILKILDTLEVKETGTVWHSFGEVLPPQGSDICVYWDRDKIITTGIWEESEKPKYASKWAYTSDLLKDK